MNKFEIGVKIYSSDWLLKYGFSPREAARALKDWGISFVLAQSRFLHMPDSAVDSETPDGASYTKEDDLAFRAALAEEGIDYWATVCTFFNPAAIDQNPDLRPLGSDGRPMEQIDWYIGIAPSQEAYVAEQVAAIEKAVRELRPDGVFLSFTRWPGFWELWMPHHRRQDFPEYSYDTHTLQRFARETGINLPASEPQEIAQWIEKHARAEWTNWKCDLVANIIRQVKEASQRIQPDAQIMLNTLPFRAVDFDNAREKVFGQNVETLNEVVDIFEVMTYHQILKQPTAWIPGAGLEVKARSGRKTVCTIQAAPLYLDGIYKKDQRLPTLDAQEFTEAVNAVESAGLDGIVIFTWTDLLKEVFIHGNTQRIEAIRAAVERRKQRLVS